MKIKTLIMSSFFCVIFSLVIVDLMFIIEKIGSSIVLSSVFMGIGVFGSLIGIILGFVSLHLIRKNSYKSHSKSLPVISIILGLPIPVLFIILKFMKYKFTDIFTG